MNLQKTASRGGVSRLEALRALQANGFDAMTRGDELGAWSGDMIGRADDDAAAWCQAFVRCEMHGRGAFASVDR